MTDARVLVVGGGPAGISAALWLRDLEIPFAWWVSDETLGGTLRRVGNPIRTLPGLDTDIGSTLVDSFASHVHRVGLAPTFKTRVDRIAARGDDGASWDVAAGETSGHFDAVLLATGTRPRRLGLPGEIELLGQGVERSVTRTRERYRHRRCVIVGGGDAALEGALLLTDVTDRITIVHRSSAFRGQPRFVQRVLSHAHIDVRFDSSVLDIVRDADGGLEAVRLSDGSVLPADGLFVRIGVEPSLPEIVGGVRRSDDGYVDTDRDGRTSREGLYAAGDVTGSAHQSVAAALGDAARAVAAMMDDLISRR